MLDRQQRSETAWLIIQLVTTNTAWRPHLNEAALPYGACFYGLLPSCLCHL